MPEPAQATPEGGLSFDRSRWVVCGPDGDVELTPLEGALLDVLEADAGGVVPHTLISMRLWGHPYTDRFAKSAIRTHVMGLRRKLRRVGADDVIRARLRLGYQLVAGAGRT